MDRLKDIPWRALQGRVEDVLPALVQVLAGQDAERVVDRLLRRHRDLTAEQRRAFVEAVFGVAVQRRRLAWHAGGEEPLGMLACLLRDLADVPERDVQHATGLTTLPSRRPPPEDLAVRCSFPDALVTALEREFGAETPALLEALNVPGPVCLRANTLKVDRDTLARALAAESVTTRPARFAVDGLVVEGARPNILGLRAQQLGWLEVQDEGSQLLGALLDVQPGDVVVDWCAGAGGKTLQLAAAMRGRGRLIGHDVDRHKLVRLRQRAVRAGILNVEITDRPPRGVLADGILVDAPCSEWGALRRGPDRRWRVDAAELAALPARQLAILEDAARALRPGGRLVYGTCTWRREENQDVVAAFLERHRDFCVEPLPLDAAVLRNGALWTAPHRTGMDGFFGVRMLREGDAAGRHGRAKVGALLAGPETPRPS